MKFSNKRISSAVLALMVSVGVFFVPTHRTHAVFTDVTQLGRDLDTLAGQLNQLQKLPGFQGGTAATSGVGTAIQNLTSLSTGLRSVQNILDLPVISQTGAPLSAGALNGSLQGLGAILDTPLFSNFDGAGKLKQTLSTLGNATEALSNIGGILDIPELQNLGGLLNGGGLTSGSGVNNLSPLSQILSGVGKLNTTFSGNSGLVSAVSGISSIPGVDTLLPVLKKIPGTGTGLISGSGASCTANVGGGNTTTGNAAVNAAANAATQAATNAAKNLLGSAFNSSVGALGSLTGGLLGGGTGNGVPVVEQDGTLIRLQQQSTNLTAIACEHLAAIREIEQFRNPTARQNALKGLKDTLSSYATQEQGGRTTAQGLTQQSFIVSSQSYQDEKVRAATALTLDRFSKASIPSAFKQNLIDQLTREELIAQDPNQELLASIGGTSVTSNTNDPLGDWLEYFKPQNNPYGSYMILKGELAQAKAEAATEAARTWEAGNGIVPEEKCESGWITNALGKSCEKMTVVTPGIYFADRGSAIRTSGLRVAENSDQFQEDINAQKALAEEQAFNFTGTNQGRTDLGITDVFNVVDNICKIKSDLSICSAKNKAAGILDTLSQITGTNLLGGGVGSTASIGTTVTGSTATLNSSVAPTISSETTFNRVSGKSDMTTLAWRATNASQCSAGNDWITFGNNGDLTLTPSVTVAAGTTFSANNSINISHPGLFKPEVSVRGSGVVQSNITSRLSGNSQVVTYVPNTAGLRINDQISLIIDGQEISTGATLSGLTAEDIVADLKSARVNTPVASAAKAFFDQFQFSGSNTLIISHSIPSDVPKSASYQLTCTGPGGSITKTIPINF